MATQICTGEANNIRIRIYGDKGGLEWRQMEPNILFLKWKDRPTEILNIGNNGYLDKNTLWNTRIPAGHPEGFIESFANIYRNFALTVRALDSEEQPQEAWLDFPSIYEGVRGMQFIETMVTASYNNNTKWQKWIE
jgi:predicted dehydrogenase